MAEMMAGAGRPYAFVTSCLGRRAPFTTCFPRPGFACTYTGASQHVSLRPAPRVCAAGRARPWGDVAGEPIPALGDRGARTIILPGAAARIRRFPSRAANRCGVPDESPVLRG